MRALRWRESLCWRLERRVNSCLTTKHAKPWPSPLQQQGRWLGSHINNAFFDFKLPESRPGRPTSTQLEDVYVRARQYGIPSEDKLAFEADIGHQLHIRRKLIDHKANRQDLELWAILLDYRHLRDGENGVQDVLYGMRFRGEPVKLYADDVLSEHLRQRLTSIGANNEEILLGLCHPHNGIGRKLPSLFVDTVGQLMCLDAVPSALYISRMLRTSHCRGQDIARLFNIFCQNHLSLKDFCAIHKQLPYTPIYTHVVPKLWNMSRSYDAWFMHLYLLTHGDLPTTFQDVEPLIRDLARQEKPLEPFLRSLETAGGSFAAQANRVYERERATHVGVSSGTLNVVASKTLGVRPRKLSDEFVARAFATQSLPLDFVLNSLRIFGLIEVGPLAIRELASRAGNAETLKQLFARLQDLEIDLGSSVFVTVVKNLCMSGSETLLQAVLTSDQHHEVYENRETQKRLLANYYYQNDWPQVNRTLAVLNNGKTDYGAQQRSRRLLLQSAIVTRDWQGGLQLLADMHKSGHTADMPLLEANSMSLKALIDIILPQDRAIRLRNQEFLRRGHYLAGFLQDVSMMGMFVDQTHWRRALYYFGDTGRITSLERLCIWLAWYYHSTAKKAFHRPRYSHHHEVVLNELFNPRFQAALIEWGFCFIHDEHSNLEERFGAKDTYVRAQRTMHLLRRLHAGFGVSMNYNLIKQEYTRRIRHLFRRKEDIELHLVFFDAVWSNDLSRIPRRSDRKAIKRARYPKPDELQQFRSLSEANPMSQQLENSVVADNMPADENVVKDFQPFIESATKEKHSIKYQDTSESQDGVVEYQDLFHPSWKEYRN